MLAIENLLTWSKPREVNTKRGPRILRVASPDDGFMSLWRMQSESLKSLGLSMMMDQREQKWKVCWWQEIPKEIQQQRDQMKEASRAAIADIQIPAPDGLQFYPFQKAAVAFALRVFDANPNDKGVLFGDDMGLGKTMEAIGVINAVPSIQSVLVVTKAVLKLNWYREIRKWLVRDLSIAVVDPDVWPKADIAIINYELLHKFPGKLAFMWDLVICDEAHKIGNRKSRMTKCIIGYKPSKKEAAEGVKPFSGIPKRRAIAITGTPLKNRPEELWSVLNFLQPTQWPSFWSFAKRYCGMQDTGWGISTKGASNLSELQDKLRQSCMIRRLKSDVLTELPAKTRVIIELEPAGKEMETALLNDSAIWRQHEDKLTKTQADLELAKASGDDQEWSKAIERLRADVQEATRAVFAARHETALAKLPLVIEYIRDELEEVNKIVVFAHHRDVLERLKKEFAETSVLVYGGIPNNERDAMVQRFQNDPSVSLFLGSMRACGEGLTLTAASLVEFVEEDWVPGIVSQCEDRCHRIGQKDSVLVKHLVLKRSTDARMVTTIVDKQKIIDQTLDMATVSQLRKEPVLVPKSTGFGCRQEIREAGVLMSDKQRIAVHDALRMLAGMCDGAQAVDGMGFSKIDTHIGHSLAEQFALTPAQAALGKRLVTKYKRQLPESLLESIYEKKEERDDS